MLRRALLVTLALPAVIVFEAGSPPPLAEAQTCTPIPPGLVSWWSGDGTSADIMGPNEAASMGPVGYLPGFVGDAFQLNGTNSYLTAPFSPSLAFTGQRSLTIDAWVNTPVEDRQMLIAGEAGGVQVHTLTDGGIRFAWVASGALRGIDTSPGVVVANTFIHVAAVFDAGTQQGRVYVDGALMAGPSPGASFGPSLSGEPFQMGAFGPPSSVALQGLFEGQLDEVQLFDRALSGAEIATIVNAGAQGTCKDCAPRPAALLSWWPGDGSSTDIMGQNQAAPVGALGYSPGLVAGAFQLNGVNSYLTAPPSPSLAFTGQRSLTIDAWINTPADDRQMMIAGEPGGVQVHTLADGGIRFAWVASGALRGIDTSGGIVVANTWTHIAAVFDAGTQQGRVVVDGVPMAGPSPGTSFGPNLSGEPFQIGGFGPPSSVSLQGLFEGQLDEVQLFERALSDAEIAVIVSAGAGGMCKGGLIVGVGDLGRTSRSSLLEASPNPGGNSIRLRFRIRGAGAANLSVFDVAGRLVTKLVDGPMPAGLHERTWGDWSSASGACASGVYFARLKTRDGVSTTRVLKLR